MDGENYEVADSYVQAPHCSPCRGHLISDKTCWMPVLWGRWWCSAEVKCTLGMVQAILSVKALEHAPPSFSAGSCQSLCLFGVPNRQPVLGPSLLRWDRLMGGSRDCLQILGFGTWTVRSSLKFLDSPVLYFHHKGVLRPMAVKASGCPSVPGFALTLCMERGLDHQPKWWGYPGRTSCRWQQTNISHYIFPFSEGHSLSS